MKYFYTGSYKQLRQNGFVIHFINEQKYTYANRGYKKDFLNSLFIWFGEHDGVSEQRRQIVFNNPAKKDDDIRPYIQDLIDLGLVATEYDEERKD